MEVIPEQQPAAGAADAAAPAAAAAAGGSSAPLSMPDAMALFRQQAVSALQKVVASSPFLVQDSTAPSFTAAYHAVLETSLEELRAKHAGGNIEGPDLHEHFKQGFVKAVRAGCMAAQQSSAAAKAEAARQAAGQAAAALAAPGFVALPHQPGPKKAALKKEAPGGGGGTFTARDVKIAPQRVTVVVSEAAVQAAMDCTATMIKELHRITAKYPRAADMPLDVAARRTYLKEAIIKSLTTAAALADAHGASGRGRGGMERRDPVAHAPARPPSFPSSPS